MSEPSETRSDVKKRIRELRSAISGTLSRGDAAARKKLRRAVKKLKRRTRELARTPAAPAAAAEPPSGDSGASA
jgi:hypothetical protein